MSRVTTGRVCLPYDLPLFTCAGHTLQESNAFVKSQIGQIGHDFCDLGHTLQGWEYLHNKDILDIAGNLDYFDIYI